MNSLLSKLQPYPFQKFSKILDNLSPNVEKKQIRLSIGEPQHKTPEIILNSLNASSNRVAKYPTTQGSIELRESISAWVERRFGVGEIDPASEVLPVNGTREALFAFAQVVLSPSDNVKTVVMPNPFYQIYEGATLLAGGEPHFLNLGEAAGGGGNLDQLDHATWRTTKLLYVCNPGNPTGHVMTLDDWEQLFGLSDQYGFVIASDECYSEIFFDESTPPLGALSAAQQLNRDFERLMVFSSLSKRSNVPGMRSGFVCGDKSLIKSFLQYRTYHGSAMNPAVQAASTVAWNDEIHVKENRGLYRQKFDSFVEILNTSCRIQRPAAGFYIWLKTNIDDIEFASKLYESQNVVVLPGSLLARDAHGTNPGKNHVRIALVAEKRECDEAAERIKTFINAGFV